MPTVHELQQQLGDRYEAWRQIIESADCEEFMPGALQDAIEACVDAVFFFEHNRIEFERLLKSEPNWNAAEKHAIWFLARLCDRYTLSIKTSMRQKSAEYNQKKFCRSPVGELMNIYPLHTWKQY